MYLTPTWKSHLARTTILLTLLLVTALSSSAPGKEAPSHDLDAAVKSPLSGLQLRGIGPALMSGRIADIAIDPTDRSTWYVAVGSGGVWKTTNAGTTWAPLFDKQASYSIGCVTLDPSNSNTVWVGTGENVGGRHVGFGDGVYRSRDGGGSWEQVGLAESQHISKIVIDPRDPKVVLVASQGPLWSPGGERGLFRSSDGGATWTQVLGGKDWTGVTDVVVDPKRPDIVYAATWQRQRSVAALMDGGPESGIHKSNDGGLTWRSSRMASRTRTGARSGSRSHPRILMSSTRRSSSRTAPAGCGAPAIVAKAGKNVPTLFPAPPVPTTTRSWWLRRTSSTPSTSWTCAFRYPTMEAKASAP